MVGIENLILKRNTKGHQMNIPIYRAKKIDSDKYIQGYLLGMWGEYFISWGETNHVPNKVQIDPTTLAIHFEDILDSEGNKIFSSLSDSGKGGDIVEYNTKKEVVKYSLGTIQTYMFRFEDLIDLEVKVIGIQE